MLANFSINTSVCPYPVLWITRGNPSVAAAAAYGHQGDINHRIGIITGIGDRELLGR